jgi:hypothetical protein
VPSTELIGGDRPIRGCDVCGGVDDHPRHSFLGDPGAFRAPDPAVIRATLKNCEEGDFDGDAILASILDTSTQDRHRDCCRQVGCPTGTCDDVAELVGEELRGADLLLATEPLADELQNRFAARSETREG